MPADTIITKPPEAVNSERPLFDAGDIDELIRRFSLVQLRRESWAAEDHLRAADSAWDISFWLEYQSAVALAIDVYPRPVFKTKPGQKPRIRAEDIKARTDILAIVGRDVRLRKSGQNFTGLCPFHSEKHPSFVVSPKRQSWHCFGACGTGGDVLAYVMKRDRCEFKEAIGILAGER